MGRRAKPAKGRTEAKRPLARTSPKTDPAKVSDLEKRLAEALQREAEALEQQTATSEILRVISRSQSDVQPVFDAIVKSAVKLCAGLFSTAFQFDGELVHLAAQHNVSVHGLVELHRVYPARPTRGLVAGRAILERAVVHIPDIELDPGNQFPVLSRVIGWRSCLVVPMLREGAPIGVITVGRVMPGRFSEREIELLKTFADQAVIAIANVRLFNETKQALDQQTATSEILQVISSSPMDVQPVFDALAESAARLCGAVDAYIFRVDGEQLRLVAKHGSIAALSLGECLPVVRGTLVGRSVLERRTVHVADIQAEPEEFPESQEVARRLGHRTILSVPLMREGLALGAISLRRTEVQLFTEREIALLQTFADQAVIALENVRLLPSYRRKIKRSRPPTHRSLRRWSSRLRRAKSCASSAVRRPTSSPCWTRLPKAPRGSARRPTHRSFERKATSCARRQSMGPCMAPRLEKQGPSPVRP
jgi:two-component system NtrC family sensor kinase